MAHPKKVLIIGAGISGLSTAFYLRKNAALSKQDLEVHVWERSQKAGGLMDSYRKDGFLMEKGPDSFITDKPAGLELCQDLGVMDSVVSTQLQNRRSFVLQKGKLKAVPEGFYLIGPSKIMPFLSSDIFSWPAKMRMMAEYFIAPQTPTDESVASFVKRRFGNQALERLAQPMLAGIYAGDPERLSLRMTMPKFLEMEAKHGSVSRYLIHKKNTSETEALSGASGPRYGLFVSFKEGSGTLAKALCESIGSNRIFLNKYVTDMKRLPDGRWMLVDEKAQEHCYDAVCVASGNLKEADYFKKLDSIIERHIDTLRYESVAIVNFIYRSSSIKGRMDGFGFVVPKTENTRMIGCSFMTRKYTGRALEGFEILRVFVGGAFGTKHLSVTDQELIDNTHQDLSRILSINDKPYLSELYRYPNSMIAFEVGYADRLHLFQEALSKIPGLYICNAINGGVGIPDRVLDARRQSQKILNYLFEKSSVST